MEDYSNLIWLLVTFFCILILGVFVEVCNIKRRRKEEEKRSTIEKAEWVKRMRERLGRL